MNVRDELLLGALGVICITILAFVCFMVTGENGTVLGAAAGAIGTVIGVVLGRQSVLARKTG